MIRFALFFALACGSPPAREAIRTSDPPPEPDYSDRASWAAHPDVEDGADVVARGETDRQSTAIADVFFVHPTTHYQREWNASIDAPRSARFVDALVLPHQAAAFNEAARVYAPRYRQATLWSFTTRDRLDEAKRAMDLAYSDVLRAFDAWASESDRPVIVAAHSQGSYHALRLLADRFESDPEMRSRLVAAYLVGIPLPSDVFTRTIPSIPLCDTQESTGCVLAWNTVMQGARPSRFRRRLPIHYPDVDQWESTARKELVCTNPIAPVEGWSPREAHQGAVLFVDGNLDPIEPRIESAVTRARCIDGVLEVEPTVRLRFRRDPLAMRGDLHLADYPLFFLDVRRDAVRRVTALHNARERSSRNTDSR